MSSTADLKQLRIAADRVTLLRSLLRNAEDVLSEAVSDARNQEHTWDEIGKATNTNRATIHRWFQRRQPKEEL